MNFDYLDPLEQEFFFNVFILRKCIIKYLVDKSDICNLFLNNVKRKY